MASVEEGPLPYNLWEGEKSSSSNSNPTDAVIFAGISLLIGVSCRTLLRRTFIPYTVVLLIIGTALGSLEFGSNYPLGKLGNGIRICADIDADLLLAVFLPILIFEGAFSMEVHQIKKCMAQMLLLAGPGVLISTVLIGAAVKLAFPYDWNWKTSLLLGAILSATDPVAVVALLKDLGASKKLSTIVEGESMMNDGYCGLPAFLSNGSWEKLWLGCSAGISCTRLTWSCHHRTCVWNGISFLASVCIQ